MTAVTTTDTLLEPGMLLLEPPREKHPRATVWTVVRVNKRSAVIVAHHVTLHATATLNGTTLPKGWRLVRNRPLASLLVERLEHEEPTIHKGVTS